MRTAARVAATRMLPGTRACATLLGEDSRTERHLLHLNASVMLAVSEDRTYKPIESNNRRN